MQTLYLTIGAPGSGKTSWANDMTRYFPNIGKVERDDLRVMVGDDYNIAPWSSEWGQKHEDKVTAAQKNEVVRLLKAGFDVIVADTNLNPNTRRAFEQIAENFSVKVDYVHFFVPRDLLHFFNSKREGWKQVDSNIVNDFYRKHVEMAPFNPNVKYKAGVWDDCGMPGFIERSRGIPYEDTLHEKAVVFDIDGTLALRQNRSPYDESKVMDDAVYPQVVEVLHMYDRKDYAIILASGRSEYARNDTESWLFGNNIPYEELHMRSGGDNIKDNVVKHDIYRDHIWPYYDVQVVYDDRQQTVDMWRAMGLTVFQVAEGNF